MSHTLTTYCLAELKQRDQAIETLTALRKAWCEMGRLPPQEMFCVWKGFKRAAEIAIAHIEALATEEELQTSHPDEAQLSDCKTLGDHIWLTACVLGLDEPDVPEVEDARGY